MATTILSADTVGTVRYSIKGLIEGGCGTLFTGTARELQRELKVQPNLLSSSSGTTRVWIEVADVPCRVHLRRGRFVYSD